jgi:hypothetical protein
VRRDETRMTVESVSRAFLGKGKYINKRYTFTVECLENNDIYTMFSKCLEVQLLALKLN